MVSYTSCLVAHEVLLADCAIGLNGQGDSEYLTKGTAWICCSFRLKLFLGQNIQMAALKVRVEEFSLVMQKTETLLYPLGATGRAAAVVFFLCCDPSPALSLSGGCAGAPLCCDTFVLCFRCTWKSPALTSCEPSKPSGEFTVGVAPAQLLWGSWCSVLGNFPAQWLIPDLV